jgi:hypothetical protein
MGLESPLNDVSHFIAEMMGLKPEISNFRREASARAFGRARPNVQHASDHPPARLKVKRGDALANTHRDIERSLAKCRISTKYFPTSGCLALWRSWTPLIDDGALTVKRRRFLVSFNFTLIRTR